MPRRSICPDLQRGASPYSHVNRPRDRRSECVPDALQRVFQAFVRWVPARLHAVPDLVVSASTVFSKSGICSCTAVPGLPLPARFLLRLLRAVMSVENARGSKQRGDEDGLEEYGV
jgi:hypothetical protein